MEMLTLILSLCNFPIMEFNGSALTATTVAPHAMTTLSPAQLKSMADMYWLKQFQILQIVYTVSYGIMFGLSMSLLVYLRRNRSTAYKGNANAARKVILPSFEPLFWVIAALTGVYFCYFLAASSIDYVTPVTISWFTETVSQGRQFTFFVVAAFLLQKSVSRPALVRSMVIAAVITVIPIISVRILDVTAASTQTSFAVTSLLRAFDTMWFVWMLVRPVSRASVRTQREFALFALVYYASSYVYAVLILMHNYTDSAMVVFCTVIWASFAPFFVWRLLRADTEHWRGLSERACEFQQHFRENQGMQEIVSAQGLHVLLEMHRKDLIDFAHLELQQVLGVGASANVYRGKLHSSIQVAVKVYSPTEISESTILEFSQEAALCTALKHPNIVLFHGMCICPPSICLVYELCRGSLEDALRNSLSNDHTEPLWPKLCYMLDAARAVAYLHSFSPPFIHRDIKPANFLLDASNVVKLTDFGESRSMAFTIEDIANDNRAMTVRGTVDYMAPEIIDGKQGQALYTETADIYSLAITLWDILHPGREKFPNSNQNHHNIFRMVLNGQRPPIDPETPQTLQDLLENCWNSDPIFRPSAKMVVTVLEELLEDLCGQVSHHLSGFITCLGTQKGTKNTKTPPVFTGEELARCFFEHKYAFEKEEAIRFGNALMDAGSLHHAKHNKPFETSATTTYYFDSQQLDLNQPMQEKVWTLWVAADESSTSSHAATSTAGDGSGLCECRKLWQGHIKPRMPVRTKNPFRRRKEDCLLTVNLLNDHSGDGDAFGDFGTHSTSGQQTTLVLQVA
ncbi:hypothetical protein DYB25_000260 [Aphanomyces astaci]|uniref:TKL protein kinase n=1 Tax=Aphanomyces astaci TaxID=112090 RepID=A0A397BG76_APHAT|nr:hypothetical protein DYB25_000260 [Aphanomyces astaci]